MLTLVLENCESYSIPKKFIVKRKIKNGHLKTLWVNDKYLEVIEKYIGMSWEGRTKEDIINRFLHTRDITQICYKGATHFVPYIEATFGILGDDNILQTVKYENNLIKFSWDTDLRNRREGKGYSVKLYLHQRYKNIIFNDYKKVVFFK